MTSIYLTDEQKKEMKQYIKSGKVKNKSEFVRRAIEVYLLYLKNPYTNLLLCELESWINKKKDITMFNKDTDVLNMNTNMFNNVTNVPNMNTNMLQNIVETNRDMSDISTDVLNMNTNVTSNNDSIHDNPVKTKLESEFEMIKRMLNNPENVGTIPDYTLKMLSKKYDLSKSIIQEFIVENKEALKSGNFDEIC